MNLCLCWRRTYLLCAHRQIILSVFTLHALHTPQHTQLPINPSPPCPRHLGMAHHQPRRPRWYLHEPRSTGPGPSRSGSSVASLASRHLWIPPHLANPSLRATWVTMLPRGTYLVQVRSYGTRNLDGIGWKRKTKSSRKIPRTRNRCSISECWIAIPPWS